MLRRRAAQAHDGPGAYLWAHCHRGPERQGHGTQPPTGPRGQRHGLRGVRRQLAYKADRSLTPGSWWRDRWFAIEQVMQAVRCPERRTDAEGPDICVQRHAALRKTVILMPLATLERYPGRKPGESRRLCDTCTLTGQFALVRVKLGWMKQEFLRAHGMLLHTCEHASQRAR